MSFELRPLVAEAKSFASTSATRIPRSAASRKIDAPVMPPPMTSRSNCCSASLWKSNGRERLLKVSRDIDRTDLIQVRDQNVVNRVAAGFDVGRVEAAVVKHRVVDVGCVVVGFVADVAAGERVRCGRKAVGD